MIYRKIKQKNNSNKKYGNYFSHNKTLKHRVDAKVIKKYDTAKSLYRRLMESSDINDAEKDELQRRKDSLDLQQLLDKTQELQIKLISMAHRWST